MGIFLHWVVPNRFITYLFLLDLRYLSNFGSDVFGAYTFLKVILINGQFPGPRLDLITNDNVVLNLINKLDEPFLLTWYGSVFHLLDSYWVLFGQHYILFFVYIVLSFLSVVFLIVLSNLRGICGLLLLNCDGSC